LNPDGFTVIDDKPIGRIGKVYPSSKHQVSGYCMALKGILGPDEQRPITAKGLVVVTVSSGQRLSIQKLRRRCNA